MAGDDRKQTSVWLPVNLYQWLRRKAFERNISQSQYIAELIEKEQQEDSR